MTAGTTQDAGASPVATVLLGPGGGLIGAAAFSELTPTPDGFMALGSDELGVDTVLARGSADGTSWERLDAGAAFGEPLDDLVVGPAGWIASHRIATATGVGVGTVLWHSADGRAWEQVRDQARLAVSFPGPLSAGAWGFAMAGQVTDSGGTSKPAVWVSRDGRAWQLVPDRPDFQPRQALVLSNAFVGVDTSLGLVAVSTDGARWGTPVEVSSQAGNGSGLDEVLAQPGPEDGTLLLLTADEDGLALRVGVVGSSASGPTIALGDAVREPFVGAGAAALETGELGTLLLGYDLRTLEPRTWLTVDGATWQRADLDESSFGSGVPGLAAVGSDALVVLGWYGSEGGDTRARPWTSSDGRSWSRLESEALGQLPEPPFEACSVGTPTDAAGFIAMAQAYPSRPAAVWPLCFEDRELTIEGWVQLCEGCGGTSPYVGSPAWLISPLGYAAFWLGSKPSPESPDGGILGVQIDPLRPVTVPPDGSHVRVTGHFDDEAASECRLVPLVGAFVPVPPATETIATCRQQFVLVEIETVAD